MAQLVSLTFNLDPSSADGSLSLRQSRAVPAPWPEWQQGRPETSGSSPVAYVLSELGDRAPRVAVKVKRESGDPEQVTLRALATGGPDAELPPPVLLPPDLIWPASHWFVSLREYSQALIYRAYYQMWQESREQRPHILGDVPRTTISFAGGQPTTTVVVTLPAARLSGRGVGASDVTWRWQVASSEGSAWHDMRATHHRVYTLPRPPTEPWHRLPRVPGDTQIPWADALDVACRWAAGATDTDTAAAAVTNAVNSLGTTLIEYGCPIGALSMYASPLGLDTFDCTAFLELLAGGEGNGRYVNCTDCASIVSTFANLLGCDLWQSRMGSYEPAFLTNPMLAIGSNRLGSPCGWGLGFTYHEVAWEGACDSTEKVYDACLQLTSDPDGPGVPSIAVPTGIRFGFEGDGQYRDLIAAPTSRAVCAPRPAERKRRILL
jgi:hypothetical protein